MNKPVHLRFDCIWSAYNHVEQDHPQKVMKDLGIIYTHSTPQSISDSWWFWNCENVPDPLPPFLRILDIDDPKEAIGWGLSEEESEEIIKYQSSKQ